MRLGFNSRSFENFANAFVRPLHLPFPIFLSYVAAFSEIIGSWLLITGFASRLGALAVFGTISIAIYHAIMTSGFNIYLLELLGLYWGGAFCVLLNGPGKFSLDYLIQWKRFFPYFTSQDSLLLQEEPLH